MPLRRLGDGCKLVAQQKFAEASMADVFISYSRKDADFVEKLAGVTRDLTPDECEPYFQSKTCTPLP